MGRGGYGGEGGEGFGKSGAVREEDGGDEWSVWMLVRLRKEVGEDVRIVKFGDFS